MNNNNKILLEIELFKEIVSQIEIYIKENMTPQEKVFAMNKIFEKTERKIKDFSKETGENEEEVVKILLEMVNEKEKTTIFKEQYDMISKILTSIKSNKEERDYC